MSPTFASKYNQRVVIVDKGGYCISAAGNDISSNQTVKDVSISISNREYTTDLIVLPGLGIDVILGMKWMSGLGVLIDTSTRVIMLREPRGMILFYYHFPETLTSKT
jgi:predicted aspartyl protease